MNGKRLLSEGTFCFVSKFDRSAFVIYLRTQLSADLSTPQGPVCLLRLGCLFISVSRKSSISSISQLCVLRSICWNTSYRQLDIASGALRALPTDLPSPRVSPRQLCLFQEGRASFDRLFPSPFESFMRAQGIFPHGIDEVMELVSLFLAPHLPSELSIDGPTRWSHLLPQVCYNTSLSIRTTLT